MTEFKRLRLYGYEVRTKRHYCRLPQGKGKEDVFVQTLRGISKLLIEMFLENDDLFYRGVWWKMVYKNSFQEVYGAKYNEK